MIRGRVRGNKNHQNHNEQKFGYCENSETSSKIINCFRVYARELDDKHDRFERIVKHSRDITVESKRLIFLLHTVDTRNSNSTNILSDAFIRLNNLCKHSFENIAAELKGRDSYQFMKAYSCGLQEFVEAFSFYEYLSNDALMDWTHLQQKLSYTADCGDYACLINPIEYMLGLADLSGEIMRKCINALNNGDIDRCLKACNFIQDLYSGYLSFGLLRNREMLRKILTMFQSVLKVENVCYNVKVRGSEAAIWSSSKACEKEIVDYDEGFIQY